MVYTVKEIFKTLQGEGYHVGTPAVFCRFSGCNLACAWCDTDFVGGQKYATADMLADAILTEWGPGRRSRFVVLTGGEPLLQVDGALLSALRERSFFVAIETNGTIDPPEKVDWLTVSPKGRSPLAPRVVPSELKLVYPQIDAMPEEHDMPGIRHKFLQPLDNADRDANTADAIAYCLAHPQWRLSLQTHKWTGIR